MNPLVKYRPKGERSVRPYDGAGGGILLGGIASVALLAALLGWAGYSALPSASIADAVVVVEGSRRPVQSRDGGIVAEVLVEEGTLVKKGQPLIRLDLNELKTEVDVLQSQLDVATATRARLNAEAAGASELVFPSDLVEREEDQDVANLLRQQRQLFQARLDSYNGARRIQEQKIESFHAQIDNLKQQIADTDKQVASINDELGGLNILLEKKLTEKSRVLTLQRQISSLTVDRGALAAQISLAENGIESAELEIRQLGKSRREEVANDQAQTEAQIADIVPKLRASRERMDRAELLSPLDGYVLNLAVHGPGATLAPGQVALEIVPAGDSLVLKARLAPRDIEQVKEGQSAEIHFNVNKSRFQKTIGGTLLKISPDRKADERTNQPYYEAIVGINQDDVRSANLAVLPGMAATAAIITGKRTVLEYFLDPILEVASFAMRES